jgi:UTP--glucose-1-phosphate uridylyltransferase
VEIRCIEQPGPRGLGDAIWRAAEWLGGDEPFAVLLPDDIFVGDGPCLAGMMAVAARWHCAAVAVDPVPPAEVERYGIIEGEAVAAGIWRVRRVVEKPSRERAPSNLAVAGRYVLTPDALVALEHAVTGPGEGEVDLTPPLQHLAQAGRLVAATVAARRYDTGHPAGYLRANLELSLLQPDLASELAPWLSDVARRLCGTAAERR